MTEVIHISVDAEGIATLLFDRSDSAMNTMDMKFMDEMEAAVERLATDDADLAKARARDAFGAMHELVRLALVDEERADHVARHRVELELGEIFRFHRQRLVHRQLRTFVQAGQDGLGCGQVVESLRLQHGVADHQNLRDRG